MALQPRIIACGTKMATMGMGIRFLGGPLLMSVASIAVGLRGVQLHTAIVQVLSFSFFILFFIFLNYEYLEPPCMCYFYICI